MANVGYHYNEKAPLSLEAVVPGDPVTVADGGEFRRVILDVTLPGGIAPVDDFVTEYEGALHFEVDTGQNYEVSIEVQHRIASTPPVTFTSAPRSVFERLRTQIETIPLSNFNSRSSVPLGTYTAPDGTDIEITEELLSADTRIIVDLILKRGDTNGFQLDQAYIDSSSEVTFYQLQEELPAASINLDHLAAAVLERILPSTTPADRGYYPRRSLTNESYVLSDDAPRGVGTQATYATWAEYAARQDPDEDDEAEITAQLLAMSRSLDRKLGMIPGGFAPIDNQTFVFDSNGGSRLWLRDGNGWHYPLRDVAAAGIKVDYERMGSYDNSPWQWDFDDAWVWPIPRNYAYLGEPIKALELRRVDQAPLTTWPYDSGSVQITGDWGWAAVPGPIRELIVQRVRDVRDAHQGGAAAEFADIDGGGVPLGYQSDRLWREVESNYSRRKVQGIGTRMRR